MEHIELLDKALLVLLKTKETGTSIWVGSSIKLEFDIDVSGAELNRIHNRLDRDGFVESNRSSTDDFIARISSEGIDYIKKKGYKGEANRTLFNLILKRILQGAGIVAAFGTLVSAYLLIFPCVGDSPKDQPNKPDALPQTISTPRIESDSDSSKLPIVPIEKIDTSIKE